MVLASVFVVSVDNTAAVTLIFTVPTFMGVNVITPASVIAAPSLSGPENVALHLSVAPLATSLDVVSSVYV